MPSSAMSSMADKKILEFPHFQIYYDLWVHALKKPADLIVLFYHYLLIHNRFKILDDEKTDYLPTDWNSSKAYYNILYTKHDINYRLEIHLSEDEIFINLTRENDKMDTLQHMKISDFVNENDFTNPQYHKSYKNLKQLYQKIQWSIDSIKQKNSLNPGSISSVRHSTFSMSSLSSDSTKRTYAKESNEFHISTLIINQIKQEKTSMDNELEAIRQDCLLTAQKEKERKELERERERIKAKVKLTKPNGKSVLYDYNPITNYYKYNAELDMNDNLDAANCTNNQYYKESFEKFKLKPARIKVIDCLKDGLLKNLGTPLVLTNVLKEKLNLLDKIKVKNRTKLNVDRQKRRRSDTTGLETKPYKRPKIGTESVLNLNGADDDNGNTTSIDKNEARETINQTCLGSVDKFLSLTDNNPLNEQKNNVNNSINITEKVVVETNHRNWFENWKKRDLRKSTEPKKKVFDMLRESENKENSDNDAILSKNKSFSSFESSQPLTSSFCNELDIQASSLTQKVNKSMIVIKAKQSALNFNDSSFDFSALQEHDYITSTAKNDL